MDWGTITVKDLVYAGGFLSALVLGYRKVWSWYYQLEDCQANYQKQLDAANLRRLEDLAQLRKDLTEVIQRERARGDELWLMVLRGEQIVDKSVSTTVELAKRHAA